MTAIVDIVRLLEALGARNIRASEGFGGRVLCSCPLGTHSDSDPSFDILSAPGESTHGYWRCYGCHEGGGLVRLVRLVLKYDGPGGGSRARAWLAKLAAGGGGVSARAPLVEAMQVGYQVRPYGVRAFYPKDSWTEKPFDEWPGVMRDYAVFRGITEDQVERWKIGYSVHGHLAGRLVFPVLDWNGKLVSYSARTAIGDRERYLTPHRSENPSPAAIFGEFFWPPFAERRRFDCVVVEGAINALAVERVMEGRKVFVGALGGSNDSPFQFVPLMGFGRLVIISDPDKAGDRLAEALELAGGPPTVRVRLPKGEDAQSLERSAPDRLYREIVDASLPRCILTN